MIPTRLQCYYCMRNYTHGGECQKPKRDDTGCLVFKADPKGCIRQDDLRIEVPMFYNFPPLDTWDDSWTMNGVDTELKIVRVNGISWNKQRCTLILHCRCEYYVNEYHEDYKKPDKKPVLKLV